MTKASEPNRRIKELPVCVSGVVFYESPKWIEKGFALFREGQGRVQERIVAHDTAAGYGWLREEIASYADAVRGGSSPCLAGVTRDRAGRTCLRTDMEGSDTYAGGMGAG